MYHNRKISYKNNDPYGNNLSYRQLNSRCLDEKSKAIK